MIKEIWFFTSFTLFLPKSLYLFVQKLVVPFRFVGTRRQIICCRVQQQHARKFKTIYWTAVCFCQEWSQVIDKDSWLLFLHYINLLLFYMQVIFIYFIIIKIQWWRPTPLLKEYLRHIFCALPLSQHIIVEEHIKINTISRK